MSKKKGKCYRCGEEVPDGGVICPDCKERGMDESDGCLREWDERLKSGEFDLGKEG